MKRLLINRRIPRTKVITIHILSYQKGCIRLKLASEIPIKKVIRPVLFRLSDFTIQSDIDFAKGLNKIIAESDRKKKK